MCLCDGCEEEVVIVELCFGDEVVVCFGECFLVDGEVFDGSSYVDEVLIIGESLLVFKVFGDKVIGGVINGEGCLFLCIIVFGGEMVLVKIICLVEDV